MKLRFVVIPMFVLAAGTIRAQSATDARISSPDAMSGKELYGLYCASCHGADARGGGPAAVALKNKPTDLTMLTKSSGGKFPLMKVQQTIQGDTVVISHGTREMPIYGDMFRDIRRDEAFVKLRVTLLTEYIESLQKK